MAADDRPDYTGDLWLVGQDVTINMAIVSSVVTLDINIIDSEATLDIKVTAQSIDLVINLEGPSGGFAVEVASDFSIYQQPYSRRGQIVSGVEQAITADNRYTITNSLNFVRPMIIIYSSAACKMKVEGRMGANYYECGEYWVEAGERSVHQLRDKDGNIMEYWGFGNLYLTPDENSTMQAWIMTIP